MKTVSDRLCRGWLSAAGGLFVALLALVLTSSVAMAQRDSGQACIQIVEQEVSCVTESSNAAGGYQWCFVFVNRSNRTISHLNVGGQSVNTGFIQPNGRGQVCVRISGTPGPKVLVLAACSRDSAWVLDSNRNGSGGSWVFREQCCEQRVELRLPECGNDNDCLDIVEQSVECRKTPNGANAYEWCIAFRNNTNDVVNWIRVDNERVNVGSVRPTGIGRACLTLYGNPGTRTFVVEICKLDTIEVSDSGRGGNAAGNRFEVVERCCQKRVEVRLPECGPEGCIEIAEQEVTCLNEGRNRYEWCFTFVNTTNHPINTLTIQNNTYNVGPVPPGGRERLCVNLTGQPGVMPVGILACYSNTDSGRGFIRDSINTERVCCDTRVEVRLPECHDVERNCCDGFEIGIANLAPVAAPNGLTGLLGAITAGPNNITKASATVVSSSVNGQPVFGYFNSGIILNPLGAGTVTPPPYGEELIWTAPGAGGISMNSPALTLEWLRFPPMAPNARRDTLQFCIRWRFTDTECRTCDTLVCYRVVRDRVLTGLGSNERKGSSVLGTERIGGELDGQNTGRMSIVLPELPEETYGTVTFTGITLQADENVKIGNVSGSSSSFTTQHGLAIAQINAQGGEKIDLTINYDNLAGRTSLGHFVLLGFESSKAPGIEQQIPVSVTLRQAGIELGGDKIEAVVPEIEGSTVETFALHLRNANSTSEDLGGLRITAGAGVKILAVGPTSSENEALLRFGAAGEEGRAYVSEASEGTMKLAPGAERKPIYLTVSYDGELAPVVEFETLNDLDEIISEGTLDLSQVSSVHNAGGVTGSTVSLSESRPNPTTGQTAISLNITKTESARLVLRDARGKEVMNLLDGETLESGTHVVNFDVSGLPNGVYFYTLETPTGAETRKLTVQK